MESNWDKLQEQFSRFVSNFEIDRELSDQKKQEFREFVNNITESEIFSKTCAEYCYSTDNQLQGKTSCTGNEHTFGFVINRERLKVVLQDLLGDGPGKRAFSLFLKLKTCDISKKEYYLKRLNRIPLANDIYNSKRIFQAIGKKEIPKRNNYKLCDAKIKPYICWSFEMESKQPKYWKDNLNNLPCRLGLAEWETMHELIKLHRLVLKD